MQIYTNKIQLHIFVETNSKKMMKSKHGKVMTARKFVVQIGWSPYVEQIKTYVRHAKQIDEYLLNDGDQDGYERLCAQHIVEVNETLQSINARITENKRIDGITEYLDAETAGQRFDFICEHTDQSATLWNDELHRITGKRAVVHRLMSVVCTVDGQRYAYDARNKAFDEIMEYFEQYKI